MIVYRAKDKLGLSSPLVGGDRGVPILGNTPVFFFLSLLFLYLLFVVIVGCLNFEAFPTALLSRYDPTAVPGVGPTLPVPSEDAPPPGTTAL
jgi:hypothetical protein